jgi:hypothetical protein
VAGLFAGRAATVAERRDYLTIEKRRTYGTTEVAEKYSVSSKRVILQK